MSKEHARNIFERNPVLTMILFWILVIVVLDLTAGAIFGKKTYQDFRISHYYLHHALKPNTVSESRWSTYIYPFVTNSLGFRDSVPRRFPLEKQSRRILILGDSHTEGVDLAFEDTFAGILASRGKPHDTEVLSAAAISYSPKIHCLMADYWLRYKRLECDEVYIFIDISDIQNEFVYRDFNPGEPSGSKDFLNKVRNFFIKRSFLVRSVRNIFREKGKEVFYENMNKLGQQFQGADRTISADLYYSFFDHFNDDVLLANPRFHFVHDWLYDEEFRTLAKRGIELGQQNISRIREICDKRQISLSLAVHPWHKQIMERDTSDLFVQSWKNFADSAGIGFINLYPLFVNQENPVEIIEKCYIRNDNHWNEYGHQKVAEALEKIIWN